MFLNRIKQENIPLLETAFSLHQEGRVLPDSFVIDTDTLFENAGKILAEAKKKNIRLYFMLKQIGRNPYIAKRLTDMGFDGAVAVDFKEAQVMMRHHIPIGNIGHLVQIPDAMIEHVVNYGPEVISVYSVEKAKRIGDAAVKQRKEQKILLRVYDQGDLIYDGQTAGFAMADLNHVLDILCRMPGIQVAGVTSFPCYLYDEKEECIKKTHNLSSVLRAVEVLNRRGIEAEIINTPSASCCETIRHMHVDGGNCAEPAHGLTGTIPAHTANTMEEKICAVYVSEISHNFFGKAYCFGGGHYRRSHMERALVGRSLANAKEADVQTPSMESIDYHLGLDREFAVGDTAVMAFRFQAFVTRADVVLVKGISKSRPEIIGIYDSLGNEKKGSVGQA